jgi:MFS family permease
MSAFEPASSLRSRTFIALLAAQFLAAFNDQAIHASAMFFAINQKFMTASTAITLMPILFYAPWAIFCTIAGFLADRYSKRNSLVVWKFVEIGIALIALLGFWLGSVQHLHHLGPFLVMSTVFLMGTHSAFFVPAKYGAMPEILQPHLLSKGNGLLESLSFLAVILGTVTGGALSFQFRRQEYMIGILLLVLAIVGAVASLLIQRMPAANPGRPFPKNLFKPLWINLQILQRSRPLALAVLGIAFFTFMVAFMRGAVYMHGETRNPPWDEWDTSLVVGVVALGVGLGSPLAGFLSGGKIELGLVPLGAVGMILSLLIASLALNQTGALVACLIAIGFFTGFYIVPMFTLLQHRAPKASKGDLLASSNFVNVVGAIVASVLLALLVKAAAVAGITQAIPPVPEIQGELIDWDYKKGKPSRFEVQSPDRQERREAGDQALEHVIIEEKGSLQKRTENKPGTEVIVGRYELFRQGGNVVYYRVQPADTPLTDFYDEERLPRYLFLAAGLMTLAILILLCRQLPDFFVRALLWLRSHGRYHLKVIGVNNLPSDGPVILATNCDRFDDCMQVLAATDRYARFILVENPADDRPPPLLRFLAKQTGLVVLPARDDFPAAWDMALAITQRELGRGNMVGITVDGNPSEPAAVASGASISEPAASTSEPGALATGGSKSEVQADKTEKQQLTTKELLFSILHPPSSLLHPPSSNSTPADMEKFLEDIRGLSPTVIVPVYCGTAAHLANGPAPTIRRVRVVIGHPMSPHTSFADARREIAMLGQWVRFADQGEANPATIMIPGGSGPAAPTSPKVPPG